MPDANDARPKYTVDDILVAMAHPAFEDAMTRVLTVAELIEKLKAFPPHYHVSYQIDEGRAALDNVSIEEDKDGFPIVDFNFLEMPF